MRLSITSAINNITTKHFESMMLEGAFPEVKFHVEDRWKSYSMFEYANTYARFMKLLDAKMKISLDPHLGVFTRKYSKSFLAKVQDLMNEITERDVLIYESRFRSFADAVMEEAMK